LNRRRPVSNEVQAIFGSMPALLQQVKANKLRPLAVGTARRSPAVPDVPTVAELGDPGFEAALWLGIVAPAGTPARAVERLNCPCRPLLSLYPLDLARISERTTARPMLGARCCGVNETCGARARRGKDPPGAILRSQPVVPAGAAVPVYGFGAELPRERSADRAQRRDERASDSLAQAWGRRRFRQNDLAPLLRVNQCQARALEGECIVRREEVVLVIPVLGDPERPSNALDPRPLGVI